MRTAVLRIPIYEEGVLLTTGATSLNFTGSGVTGSVDAFGNVTESISGGGTPGGANTSIQYNNGGVFGGFGTYDGTYLSLPTGKAFQGQYTNLNGTAYINPDGSAVFASGSVVINTGGELSAVSVRGQYLKSDNDLGLYDNIVGQYGSIDLDNSIYYFRDWDGAYNTLRAYAFVADPAGSIQQFVGGSGDLGAYPFSGGYFAYTHQNSNYDSFTFVALDPNDEWGGGSGISSNPEEGSAIYSQSSGFQTGGNSFSLYTPGGAVVVGDVSGARIYGTQGSATSPTYGFLSDLTTGAYLFSASVYSITVQGTDRILVGNAAVSISLNTGITGALTVSTSVMTPFIFGASTSGANFNIRSTSNATKGKVTFGLAATTAFDEVNNRFGIGTASPTSTLHTLGSFAGAYRQISALRTLDITDYAIECTANSFTVTLPSASGITGRMYMLLNSGAGTITFNGLSLTAGQAATVISNGTTWKTF